jgi:hypothetical protein
VPTKMSDGKPLYRENDVLHILSILSTSIELIPHLTASRLEANPCCDQCLELSIIGCIARCSAMRLRSFADLGSFISIEPP